MNDDIFGYIGLAIPVILIAGIVWFAVWAVNSDREREGRPVDQECVRLLVEASPNKEVSKSRMRWIASYCAK